MKIYHITEAPKNKVGDRKEPKFDGAKTTPSDGKPLKGQSLKLKNGVNYQWKGANWIVTDTSEFKGKNPPKKGSIADRNAKELLNQKAAKVNGVKVPAPKVDAPSGNAPKVDSPKAVDSNIDGGGEAEAKQKAKNKGVFTKIKDMLPGNLMKWMRSHVQMMLGSTVAGWVMKVFAISGIVSLYNSYFDEIYDLVEAKEEGASNDKLMSIHDNLKKIRQQLITETTDLMVGSIGLAFGSVGMLVGAGAITAAASFLTGGAAAPLTGVWAVFAGAVVAYGTYEGSMMVCKMESVGAMIGLEVSIYDYTKNKLGTTWLSPDNLADALREAGAEQTFINYVMGLHRDPLKVWMSPAAIPGINSGLGLNQPVGAVINKVKDVFDHKDHSELNRIMELSGVVQEEKSKKIKLDDLPDELKKLAILGAKTIVKADKEDKST
jgi:hypothetical protein